MVARLMAAAMKRAGARPGRGLVMATSRVARNKECDGESSKSNGEVVQRGRW
jgi:hypothetical protein